MQENFPTARGVDMHAARSILPVRVRTTPPVPLTLGRPHCLIQRKNERCEEAVSFVVVWDSQHLFVTADIASAEQPGCTLSHRLGVSVSLC